MTVSLRHFQRSAVDACFAYWRKGGGNPLVVAATGAGKSIIAAQLAKEIVDAGSRALIVTHVKELIEQDTAACRAVWPDGPIGVFSAGLGLRQVRSITVAGVQSVYKKAKQLGNVGVVIVDEAHRISPDAMTTYRTLLDGLRDINPDLRVAGLTATPFRESQGLLTHGPDKIFDSVVYDIGVRQLINEGFLSTLVSQSGSTTINVDDVRTQAGDYVIADLELAADVDDINETVAKDVTDALRQGRTSALLFGVSVAHATRLMWALRTLGVSAEVITGDTPPDQRRRIIADFRARKIQALSSCNVLSVGFDAPCVDIVALVRPTKSTSLYIQQVGRGLRKCDGKTSCLILDYGGSIARFGPIDDVRPPKPKNEGNGEMPFKTCPECSAEVPAAARVCPECDFEFPEIVRKANPQASKLSPLSAQEKASLRRRRAVGDVTWAKHTKRDNPDATPTLRLDYYGDGIGKKIASEWVCLEHAWGSFAWRNAQAWWVRNAQGPAPETIDDAVAKLDAGLMKPLRAIVTEPDGKYTRVVGHEHAPIREPGADDDAVAVPAAPVDDGEELPF